jgi:hypothetical protein
MASSVCTGTASGGVILILQVWPGLLVLGGKTNLIIRRRRVQVSIDIESAS